MLQEVSLYIVLQLFLTRSADVKCDYLTGVWAVANNQIHLRRVKKLDTKHLTRALDPELSEEGSF
jgi:hypothetical protein